MSDIIYPNKFNKSDNQAGQSIKGSAEFGLTPSMFEDAQGAYPMERKPASAPDTVTNVMNKSQQHAQVMKDDVETLSAVDKFFKYTSNAFEGKNVGGEFFKLKSKQVTGQLSPDEIAEMDNLQDEYTQIQLAQEQLGFNFGESFLSETIAGVYDMALSAKRTPGPLVIGTAGGVATGFGLGLLGANPLSVAGGSVAGGITGLKAGLFASQMVDGYQQAVGQTYYEFQSDPSFQELPDAERKNLAKGAGVVMSAVTILPTFVGLRNTPFFNKFGPKWLAGQVKNNPVAKSALKRMAQTGAAEGGEEGIQELIQATATAMGKTWNGEETDFWDGLNNALSDSETWTDVAKATALGTAVGSTVQGGANILGGAIDAATSPRTPAPTDVNVDNLPTPAPDAPVQINSEFANAEIPFAVKGHRAIALKTLAEQVIDSTQETKTNKIIPEDLNEIIQNMYETNGQPNMYFDKVDLNKWANNEAKAQQITELIGAQGESEAAINAPIKVPSYKVVELARKDRSILDLVKESPEGPPVNLWENALRTQQTRLAELAVTPAEGVIDPNVQVQNQDIINNHEAYIASQQEGINQAQAKAETTTDPKELSKLVRAITAHQKNIAERQTRIEELRGTPESQVVRRDNEIVNEEQFLGQEILTEELGNALPAGEVLAISQAEQEVRLELADALRENVAKETVKVQKFNEKLQIMFEQERIRDEVQSQETIQIVEDFLNNNKIADTLTPEQQKIFDSGRPLHAIDPASLTDQLRSKFANDATLKKRKVFRKGGLPISEVVQTYGASDSDALLTILRDTPTYQEYEQAELKRVREEVRSLQEGDKDIEESLFTKAYDNVSRLHLKTAKELKDKHWTTFRKGIERMNDDIRALNSNIRVEAQDQVLGTQVRDLNVNQWVVAEKRSARNGMRAYLRGRLEEGFREKTNAAKAAQLTKFTRGAIAKSNRAFDRIASFSDPRTRAELTMAGPEFEKVARFFIGNYNFVPGLENDISDLNTFIKQMRKEGRLEFEISEEQMLWLEPTQSPEYLTVAQLGFIDNYLRKVRKLARDRNTIVRGKNKVALDMIASELKAQALQNPNYKEGRANDQTVPDAWEALNYGASLPQSMIANNQVILQELDGTLKGKYYETLQLPILGTNQFESPTGLKAAGEMSGRVQKNFIKKVKKHYKGFTKFKNYAAELVEVPEFRQSKNFRNGLIRKDQMLMMLANISTNKAYVENFGIDPEVAMTVLKRELTVTDFDFVQDAMWGLYKSMAPQLNAVYKARTGLDLDFVQVESFEAFGKTYEGGYFPALLTGSKSTEQMVNQIKAEMDANNPLSAHAHVNYNPAYDGIVRSHHTKKRNGSNDILDLDFNRFSESVDSMIWDITMSQPVREVMDIMTHPTIREDIINQVGKVKYNTLVNNVAELTKSMTASNRRLHSEVQGFLEGVVSKAENAAGITWIAYNFASFAMTSHSVNTTAMKMGYGNWGKYWPVAATKLVGSIFFNQKYFKQMINIARRVDPSFNFYEEGLTDSKISALDKVIPKENLSTSRLNPLRTWTKGNKVYTTLDRMREGTAEIGLQTLLGNADKFVKLTAMSSTISMYMNGDAKGHSYDSVWKGKTYDQVMNEAIKYAGQFMEDTTMRASVFDKSPLQKIPLGKSITRFMSEPIRALNASYAEFRGTRRDAKKIGEAVRNKDWDKAAEAFNDTANRSMNLVLYSAIAIAIGNAVRYGVPFLTDEEEADKREAEFVPGEQLDQLINFIGYHLEPINPDSELNVSERVKRSIEGFNASYGQMIPFYSAMAFSFGTAQGQGVPKRSVSFPALGVATDVVAGTGSVIRWGDLVAQGLSINEAFEELTPQEVRSILMSGSYFMKGIPGVGQANKLYSEYRYTGENPIPDIKVPAPTVVLEAIDSYLGPKKDEPAKEPTNQKEEFEEELKDIKRTIQPLPEGNVISDEAFEIIKYAESGGRWNARAGTSSASGYYQFTDSTWSRVVNSPEGRRAGLTMNGRVSQRHPEQQEKGVRILAQMNAQSLRNQGVPINPETIYFAHHFGPSLAKSVYLVDPDSKLARGKGTILSNAVLSANPTLVTGSKDGVVPPVKTAGDMRAFIRWNLDRGYRSMMGEQLKDDTQNSPVDIDGPE